MTQHSSCGGTGALGRNDGSPWLESPGLSPPARPGTRRGPGWAARITFWAALVIGSSPELVMPLTIRGMRAEFYTPYTVMMVMVVTLELVLGLIALLIVKASPMTMRLLGMGLLLFGAIYPLVLRYLMPMVVNRVVESFGSFALAMHIQSIIWTFHGGVVLAGTLIAWNLVRNRAWWTNLVAAGYAMFSGLVVSFVEWGMNVLGSSFMTAIVLTQFLALGLTFAGLGLLHLIGSLSSGSLTGPRRCRNLLA